ENLTDIPKLYPLRRTLSFKIGVNFDLISKTNSTERIKLNENSPALELDPDVKQIIRLIQTDLPICHKPFLELASGNSSLESKILRFLSTNLQQAVRRYIATFRHRNLGVRANGMVVWQVPENELSDFGHRLAGYSEVSHCYARETFPGFQYNVYSMIHAPTLEKLWDMADKISSELGCGDYLVMDSTVEYKKCRLRYFLPELDHWWAKHEKLVMA
ncbi:MAG: hypothetical protein OEZ36_13385, partial [Spirochaetota bacterium]|nr:hypothetical protein [Spirochaetota bacterium]